MIERVANILGKKHIQKHQFYPKSANIPNVKDDNVKDHLLYMKTNSVMKLDNVCSVSERIERHFSMILEKYPLGKIIRYNTIKLQLLERT